MNECLGKTHTLGEKKHDLRALSKLNFVAQVTLDFIIYRITDNFINIHAKVFTEIISKNKQY